MKAAALSLCAAALLAAGCESSTSSPRACTANIVSGLQVTVVDSLTDVPPASALLIARSGAFVDSVGPVASALSYPGGPYVLRLNAATERAGTYDLTVRAPGYRDWSRSGVRVTADECHVHPVAVTARLRH